MARDPRARNTILVDSSALVYLIEAEELSPRRRATERFLAEAASRGDRVIASTIAWAELLERPLALGDSELAGRYRRLLSDSSRIELAVVDAAVAERAAALAAALPRPSRRSLSDADLLQIATAIVEGASSILTNDEAWARADGCPPLAIVDELAAEMEF